MLHKVIFYRIENKQRNKKSDMFVRYKKNILFDHFLNASSKQIYKNYTHP